MRLDQTGAFPFAKCGRAYAEPFRQGTDERAASFLRYRFEVTDGGFDGLQGAAVIDKLGVAFVDEPQCVIGRAPVDRLHDRRGRPVPVSGHEGEECLQRMRV